MRDYPYIEYHYIDIVPATSLLKTMGKGPSLTMRLRRKIKLMNSMKIDGEVLTKEPFLELTCKRMKMNRSR